jgi:hypothetical protein
MNSASMATNLLGESVVLKDQPEGCSTNLGKIVLVSIDNKGIHFLIEVEGRLLRVDDPADITLQRG